MVGKDAQIYSKDPIWKIKGYAKAKADKQVIWHVHHKREIIFKKDSFTFEFNTARTLKKANRYFSTSANELEFLDPAIHSKIHKIQQKIIHKKNVSAKDTKFLISYSFSK